MRKVLGTYEKPMVEQTQDGVSRYLFAIMSSVIAIFIVFWLVNNTIDMLNFIDVNSGGPGGLTHDADTIVWLRYILSGGAAVYCFKQTS